MNMTMNMIKYTRGQVASNFSLSDIRIYAHSCRESHEESSIPFPILHRPTTTDHRTVAELHA